MKRVRRAREGCWKTALGLNLKAIISPSVRVPQPMSNVGRLVRTMGLKVLRPPFTWILEARIRRHAFLWLIGNAFPLPFNYSINASSQLSSFILTVHLSYWAPPKLARTHKKRKCGFFWGGGGGGGCCSVCSEFTKGWNVLRLKEIRTCANWLVLFRSLIPFGGF